MQPPDMLLRALATALRYLRRARPGRSGSTVSLAIGPNRVGQRSNQDPFHRTHPHYRLVGMVFCVPFRMGILRLRAACRSGVRRTGCGGRDAKTAGARIRARQTPPSESDRRAAIAAYRRADHALRHRSLTPRFFEAAGKLRHATGPDTLPTHTTLFVGLLVGTRRLLLTINKMRRNVCADNMSPPTLRDRSP